MRTLFSLLLMPIILLGQHEQHQNAPPNMEVALNLTMESTFNEEIDFHGVLNDAIELVITVEVYVLEIVIDNEIIQPLYHESTLDFLPKHLSTFSLVGLTPMTLENQNPQRRLNRLLASNDPMFSKEDVLFDWLNPIRYELSKLDGPANIPEGFGPRIRI